MHLVDLVVLRFYSDLATPIYFLKWNRYSSACENLPNHSCHFWKCNSVFLRILHQFSMLSNITPLYFLSSKTTYFGQKETIKVQVFETSQCSGWNLSNSSCQFWNDKSISLQILHHSSSPLWILSSYFFYFVLKDPIKLPILRLSSTLVKTCHIPHFIFQTQVSFSSNFASLFIAMKDNSSVPFYVKL